MEEYGSKKITDHSQIRKWVEDRNGIPAQVNNTHRQGKTGLLRIDFPDGKEENLEPITWEEFFEKFDQEGLAFVCAEKNKSGETSYFNKLVNR